MLAFLTLILKNILRQRARTTLTVLGISLGIATIVSLGIITEGLKDSLEKTIKSGQADFTVAQARAADLTYSIVNTEQVEAIKKTKGVKGVAELLVAVARTKGNPYFILFGANREGTKLAGVDLVKGRLFNEKSNEIVIGKIAAKNLKKGPGDVVILGENSYKVVGVFQTGNPFQDGGGFLSIKTLQAKEQKKDQVTMVLVDLLPEVRDVKKFAKELEKKFDGKLATISSVAEYAAVDQGIEIVDFTSQAISILAIVIGGIGVMNTVMMSVFERTREIGILRAIGWKRRRVLTMIVGESLVLGIFSILVGTGLGLLAVEYIMSFPVAQSFLNPDYSAITFERAILVGILVSLLGGIYPAYRATRFSPAEALRYE